MSGVESSTVVKLDHADTRPHHPSESKREIIRCLKRYVAREIYAALTGDQKLARAA